MFVDTQDDLIQYLDFTKDKMVHIIPLIESDKQHFIKNGVLAFYVLCDNKEFIFPYKHPESTYSDYTIQQILDNSVCCMYHRSILDYMGIDTTNILDLELVHYLNTGESLDLDDVETELFYSRLHPKYGKVNTLVSIANFVKYSRSILTQANLTKAHGVQFYGDMMQLFRNNIEKNGLKVNKQLFTTMLGTPVNLVDDLVYTKYNFFTATGRPSNRFGGINFAALPKQDETRKCFVSRFDEGKLVEIDFKAYHPHIIAYLCDYDFGNENVYEHLAKYYFDTTTPSKDEIARAKEYTFNQIYGGINKKYLHIEFFAKTKAYTDLLWEQFKDKGCVVSGISGRTLLSDYETSTDTQLFNYYIQMTETELNYLYLSRLLSDLDMSNAVPILYTYDAVVFDCKKGYIDKLIEKLFAATTEKFPISVKIGDNYKEMTNYNYEATVALHIHR
jgi:hypothetical protein